MHLLKGLPLPNHTAKFFISIKLYIKQNPVSSEQDLIETFQDTA